MWSIISTSIIGAVGAFIAWQQWRIAEIRLRHDTMHKRQRIYEAAKTLLVVFQHNAKVSQENYFTYYQGVVSAEFIFDDDPGVIQYLQTLRERTIEQIRLQTQGSAQERADMSRWFTDQFDVLRSKFRSSMRLHPPSVREQVKQCVARFEL